MTSGRIRVGWIDIFSGLNLVGQRPNEQKLGVPEAARQYHTPENEAGTWEGLPYSVGLLQAYAQRHASDPSRFEFAIPVHRRMPLERAVDAVADCDVVGFSTYVWNINRSLAIARRLKERSPATLTIFGGPQVPDRAEEFLREHRCVDLAVHGEGERVFLEILERAGARDWSGVPSISYLDAAERFVQHPRAPRIADIDTIPSPYLSGVFDPLIAANPGSVWYAVLETNRGCPFACTFCDWGSAVATKVRQFDLDRVRGEIDWMAAARAEYVFCCDANFGMFPRDIDIARHAGHSKRTTGYPIIFATQATKNATERSYAVQMAMAEDGVQGAVTISYQSMDPHTLAQVKRQNISLDSFTDLQARYVRAGVPTYTDMIIGLPGETYDSYTRGLETVIAAGQHERIAFYDCALLPNAELAQPESRRRHGLRTVRQRIIEPHGPGAGSGDDVDEFLEIVVATDALPPADWRRAKVHTWWLELLYFDRLFQVPMAIASGLYGVSSRELVEAVMHADAAHYPAIAALGARLESKARAVEAGQPQLTRGGFEPDVWWPVDQFEIVTLVQEWKLDALLDEVEALLRRAVAQRAPRFDRDVWSSAVTLNRRLFRRPFYMNNVEWESPYDIWSYYRGIVAGRPVALSAAPARYRAIRTGPAFRSIADWCEYLMLCQNHKSGYFYPLTSEPALAPALNALPASAAHPAPW